MVLERLPDVVLQGGIEEQTGGHDHEQHHDPLGFLRESEEAKKRGAFKNRKSRSVYCGPLYPSSSAWAGNVCSSSSLVATMTQLCGATNALWAASEEASTAMIWFCGHYPE
jgi:hypothetical protein